MLSSKDISILNNDSEWTTIHANSVTVPSGCATDVTAGQLPRSYLYIDALSSYSFINRCRGFGLDQVYISPFIVFQNNSISKSAALAIPIGYDGSIFFDDAMYCQIYGLTDISLTENTTYDTSPILIRVNKSLS